MLNLLPTLLAALAPQGPGTSTAPVVINEFQYDDSSTDDREFVELYNRSNAPVDISGWVLVDYDQGSTIYGGTGGTDPSYTIPTGTILQPGGFWVMGSAVVPNVNQIIGTTNLLENDQEALELRDTTGAIIDSVTYEMGRGVFGPHPLEGDGFYGDLAVADAATGTLATISRKWDGYDNDDNGRDFTTCAPSSPGATNNVASVLPLVDNFDLGSVGAPLSGWNYGFVAPKYIDPTVLDANNPTVKPASPQGGLAMSWQDNSGGGNGQQLITEPVRDVVVECYAWMEPAMTPVTNQTTCTGLPQGTYAASDGEWWAIGVRGSTTANGNPPNVPGDYFTIVAPGVGFRPGFASGIAWAHYRTAQYSRLYLVDLNNGENPRGAGADWTILAGPIDISGQNAGWQRLRLHAQGDRVVANFGGTYGCDDGMRFSASGVYDAPGPVWLSYREAICQNALMIPAVIDALDIHAPTTAVTFFGQGSPTTVGTPQIDTDGFAIPGTTGFAIKGSGMIPMGAPNYAFCGWVVGFTAVPTGYPIPGTPGSVLVYPVIAGSAIGFADAQGNVRFPFSMPCVPQFLGTSLTHQLVDFDPMLFVPVSIGTSRAVTTVVGN